MFAQDEGGEGLVGYADVQVNLKDINDNAPIFPQGVYFGNVTENGTAGMVVMTMTAVDYDDPNEGKCGALFFFARQCLIVSSSIGLIVTHKPMMTETMSAFKCPVGYRFLF